MSLVRVREHVNPLAIKYQTPSSVPDWSLIYPDFSQPLHLDIGCARGKFLLDMAGQQPDWNFLGLEIREPLVIQANEYRDEAELRNLHYLFCNANNSLRPLLGALPEGMLQRVSIQFPDPWFKKRHQKRRVVQEPLVRDLADLMPVGSQLFIQSDVLPVAAEMRDRFQAAPEFRLTSPDWLAVNPMPVPTERELSTLQYGEPVYRLLFDRR
jgi:tRNA (guanine-N7-)-methyltransferase